MGSRTRIACIMAAQSYWTGKRLYWDASWKRSLNDTPSDQTPKRLSLKSIP